MSRDQQRATSGFSTIEVLVAAVILAVIALGLVPLYSRAIRSNVEGFDYSQISNYAKSRAEEYLQLPFASPSLRVPAGSTELEAFELFSQSTHEWAPATADQVSDPVGALFVRTTTVRNFDAKDINTPLDGGASEDSIHLKEITVRVTGTREAGSPLGPGKDIVVRVIKAQ